MITAILAGGIGTRFWPLSTPERPKQFIKLVNGKSFFDLTVERVSFLENNEIYAIAGENYAPYLNEIPGIKTVFEPCARGTFGAFLLMTKYLYDQKRLSEPVVFMPSDHLIRNKPMFREDLTNAIQFVQERQITVTFGLTPTYPETGFGYIRAARILDHQMDLYGVKAFKEKPDYQLASYYLKSKHYFWNCGIVVTTADAILKDLKQFLPEYYELIVNHSYDHFIDSFETLPDVHFERAILEKTFKVAMIRAHFEWSDMGSWQAYFDVFGDNAPRVISLDSSDNQVFSDRKTILIDVEGLTIVESSEGLLVMRNGSDQKLKDACMTMMQRGIK